MSASSSSKRKIAILGGGLAALSTAFQLTSRARWQDEFEITVYQLGWRLGGKGASGRNAAVDQRIEEHGVHVFCGFYENAFRLMRECYAELPAGGPFFSGPFEGENPAFIPVREVTVMEASGDSWIPWVIPIPGNDALPGDGEPPPTPWETFRALVSWLAEYTSRRLEQFGSAISDKLDPNSLLSLVPLLPERSEDPTAFTRSQLGTMQSKLGRFGADVDSSFRLLDDIGEDVRRFRIVTRLAACIARGMVKDRIIRHGFQVIDHLDFTQWLRKHGAGGPEVWWSGIVQALYAAGFAYEPENVKKRNFAAGVALRVLLRMFLTYKGALAWRMQAGMGDTVFAPCTKYLRIVA